MAQRIHEPRRCIGKRVGSGAPVGRRRLARDARPTPSLADQPSRILEIRVSSRNGVGCNAQITGKLAHCWQWRIGCERAALDRRANLLEDLLIRRRFDLWIDGDQKLVGHALRSAAARAA